MGLNQVWTERKAMAVVLINTNRIPWLLDWPCCFVGCWLPLAAYTARTWPSWLQRWVRRWTRCMAGNLGTWSPSVPVKTGSRKTTICQSFIISYTPQEDGFFFLFIHPARRRGKNHSYTPQEEEKNQSYTQQVSEQNHSCTFTTRRRKKKFKHSTRRQQQKWRKWMLSALMSCWGLILPGIKTKWFKRKEKRPQFYHGLVLTQNATDDFGQLTICMSKTILPDICPPPWNKLNCGWQWLYWHWSVNSQWWMDHRHSNTLGLVKLST